MLTVDYLNIWYRLLQIANRYDEDVRRSLKFVLARCYIGDWFVLYQLSKNCNPYFFREFIKELSHDLRAKPKKSRSEASSSKPHVM